MKYLLLVLFAFSCMSCSTHAEKGKGEMVKDPVLYRKYKTGIAELRSRYEMYCLDNPSDSEIAQNMSDSVLSLIDSALVYFPDFYSAALFLELKIRFLCERNRFDEAIRTVSKRKEWNLSGDSLYPYRKILLNRLKAMKGSHEQNIVDKHKYLEANIKLLQEYWDAHNDEICEYMHISGKREALKGPYFVCLLQYYRYYSALYGIDEAYKKLSELQNIEPVLLSFIEDEITRDIMLYP